MTPCSFREAFLRKTGRNGFTLVEMIVSTVIVTFLAAIFFRVIDRINNSAQPRLTDRLGINMDGTRATNLLLGHIRESLEIVRPSVGETSPFLVLKDSVNEIGFLYLESDQRNSEQAKKELYRLVYFRRKSDGTTETKTMFDSIRRLTFTCLTPNQIQIYLILANKRYEFGVYAQVALMTFGGFE